MFIPNKLFPQVLEISATNFIFLKIFNSEFLYIEVSCTDHLEIEDKVSLTLVIYKIRNSIESRDLIFLKGYGFVSFA